eukprot:scaffold42157_cov283-Amphora_coffeaeformis.AAC.1
MSFSVLNLDDNTCGIEYGMMVCGELWFGAVWYVMVWHHQGQDSAKNKQHIFVDVLVQKKSTTLWARSDDVT